MAASPPSLTSRFAFQSPALLFARATLEDDHLALAGWTWRGRYRRRIPLDRILHADARGSDELILWLFDGETLRLRVKQARTWKAGIEARTSGASSHPGQRRRSRAGDR